VGEAIRIKYTVPLIPVLLDGTLHAAGFSGRGGRDGVGGTDYWRNLAQTNQGRYHAGLGVLVAAARQFDLLCGTEITPPTIDNLRTFVPGFGFGS